MQAAVIRLIPAGFDDRARVAFAIARGLRRATAAVIAGEETGIRKILERAMRRGQRPEERQEQRQIFVKPFHGG